MILGLLMGCNNGGESASSEKGLSEFISNQKKVFLDAFVSFGDLLKDTFVGIDANTTKKDVGVRLGKVGEEVKAMKDKLEGIKGSESYNLIKDKADSINS